MEHLKRFKLIAIYNISIGQSWTQEIFNMKTKICNPKILTK